jgi:hypothetical protein
VRYISDLNAPIVETNNEDSDTEEEVFTLKELPLEPARPKKILIVDD